MMMKVKKNVIVNGMGQIIEKIDNHFECCVYYLVVNVVCCPIFLISLLFTSFDLFFVFVFDSDCVFTNMNDGNEIQR